MKKLIQEWLMDQLGIVIDFNKVNFAKKVRDGYLISQVLCGFEVISKEELSFVTATEDKEEAFTNFVNYILIWLGRLNITIKDSELNDIINEKGNAGMNLFYELYLALQSKSKLHFITQRLILEKSRNSDGKFEVDKVKESLLQDMKFESGINCGLLVANADIIKWHKDRLIALNKHCEQARADYINYFKAKKGRKPKAVCTCKTYCPCQKPQEQVERLDFPDEASEDFTFQELMESYEQSKKIETVKPDYNEAKKVMRQLKSKRFEAKQRELQKTQLHTELCDEFWKNTIRKQENAIQELVDEKVLSQSFYERQMISKMLQVKHQQEVIKENRQFINDQIMKQKENDVINHLIMDQRLTDECACDFIYEKGRIEELHRRVYAEKLRLRKERIEKICRETAEDLVNFAIRLGEFEDEYHDKPSRRRYDDWVSLFVSGGSILPKVVPAEDILQVRSINISTKGS
ncbi:hypothetical protein WA026_000046 [Henosepilachna vigintioctopunctata]|uniref:Calponin-homology (CH) domain-containing protein n=1 Tax=Henosepilachna vigintioctopunctata TaxID=420089 RepID=A0AAW1V2Y8_9CUCU